MVHVIKFIGMFSMGNTIVVGQGQVLQEEFHGQDCLLMKRLKFSLPLTLFMPLNGSIYRHYIQLLNTCIHILLYICDHLWEEINLTHFHFHFAQCM